MSKITKKEVRQSLQKTIAEAILKFNASAPSRKIKKLTEAFSKKVASELKSVLKKKTVKKKEPAPARKIAKKSIKKDI